MTDNKRNKTGKPKPKPAKRKPKPIPEDTQQKKQQLFLEAFGKTGIISHAAKAVGVDRRTVYNWRGASPEFEEAFVEALDVSIGVLEDEAKARAMGLRGEKPSDLLLIFMLKAARPHIYRDFSGMGFMAQPGQKLTIEVGEPRNAFAIEDRITGGGNGKRNGNGKK